MAWMAWFCACAVAGLLALRDGVFLRRLPWIGAIVLAGNVLRNSLLVATAVTIGILIFDSLAGYAFAKFKFPGRTLMFGIVLATLMIPLASMIIPLFMVVKSPAKYSRSSDRVHSAIIHPPSTGGPPNEARTRLIAMFDAALAEC